MKNKQFQISGPFFIYVRMMALVLVILANFHVSCLSNEELNHRLLKAISEDNQEQVGLFLKLGADPNARRHKDAYSALMEAAGNGDLEIVKLLVEAGADVNFEDNSLHCSPVDLAASNGNAHVIEYLVEQGAELDAKRGSDCLVYAAAADSLESVKVLLRFGCPASENSLQAAIIHNNVPMARVLMENGAPINEVSSVYGVTPLMKAVLMNREADTLEMVTLLLHYGADDSVCSQDLSFTGMKASEIASELGFAEIESEILNQQSTD